MTLKRTTDRQAPDHDENGNLYFAKPTNSTVSCARSFNIRTRSNQGSKGTGNKLIEAIVTQINTRSEFRNKLPLSPTYYRIIWLNIAESVVRASRFYPGPHDEVGWVAAWNQIRRTGSCGVEYFNRLLMLGVAHCLGKSILVFDSADSLSVVSPEEIGGTSDSVPIVLGFTGECYHGLVPLTTSDVTRTVFIVSQWSAGVREVGRFRGLIQEQFGGMTPPPPAVLTPPGIPSVPVSRFFSQPVNIVPRISARPTLKRLSYPTRTSFHHPGLEDRGGRSSSPEPEIIHESGKTYIKRTKITRTSNFIEDITRPPRNKQKAVHPLMSQGITLAKQYFVDLIPGTPNAGDGNCSIESVMDQVNSRACFPEKLEFSAQFYRATWMRETELRARDSPFFLDEFTDEQWAAAWSQLRQNGEYELDYFGDLMIVGIMHCVRKNALVFNVSSYRSHGPVIVVRGDYFGAEVSEESAPLVLAYDGAHYESVTPRTEKDVQKTVYIVKHWNNFIGADMHAHLAGISWFTENNENEGRTDGHAVTDGHAATEGQNTENVGEKTESQTDDNSMYRTF